MIVLPSPVANGLKAINTDTSDAGIEAIQRILMMDTHHLSREQMIAYQRTSEQLRAWLTIQKPPFGLFAGLVEVADDFDAPLPDEIVDLFYGNLQPSPCTTATHLIAS